MAFLDNIFSSGGYSGLLGDLLSRLSYPQPQPSGGFPDSYGNYGGVSYPINGTPQDEQPPATTELMAQRVQPQAQLQAQPQQTAPQPQSTDLLSRLQAGAANFTTGGNP